MTPETAVTVAVAMLERTGARVAEVPEAFVMVRQIDASPPANPSTQIVADLAICPRWRLTLDRPVTLRGANTGQVVRTQTVYVTRSESGCHGKPVLQIPKPSQPETIPFMYNANQPRPGSRIVGPNNADFRWIALRVIEPIWFQSARP